LAELAVEIYRQRQELLRVLSGATPLLYRDIAGETVEVGFEYIPSVQGVYEDEFLEALARNLTRGFGGGIYHRLGHTGKIFGFTLKIMTLPRLASRGETRTLVLAMKLAELGYAEEHTGVRPLLLLDDVFSEAR